MNLPVPSKRDEPWRYSDLTALERVWPRLNAPEKLVIPADERTALTIDALPVIDGVAIRALEVELGEGAQFHLHALVAGADYGRLSVKVTLAEGAHFEFGGAMLGSGTQTLEIVTETIHAGPHATSNQVVRSVLGERATGSFLGKIHVARHAQKTDAAQSVKAMLLDRTATANAKPELEIYADDVKCAHGATVGELDRMALFYMAARGLPPAISRRLMLQAFVADAFVAGGDAREALEEKAQFVLEAML